MNDETDKPLNTIGDDALEARITAWVLGEASSFEAGELEKLCAADPALGLFERRLRVLHGLVAEDFKAGPDAAWKLSAARRAKITDLLGVEPEVVEVLPRRKRSRSSSVRGLILALAACVVIGVASFALLGGVGQRADMAMMKESARIVSYSAAPEPEAMVELEALHSEARSLRLEREGGAPLNKPDNSYAHLGTNSPFTTKAPPASLPAAAASREKGEKLALRKAQEADAAVVTRPEQAIAANSEAEAVATPPVMPPAPPAEPAALAANEPQPEILAKRMATTRGSADLRAESAPEIASRTNEDFISPAGGAVTDGPLTSGNRSGDAAIARAEIDAVLNQAARPATPEGQREESKSLAGTLVTGGTVTDRKAGEKVPDEFQITDAAGIAGPTGTVETGKAIDPLLTGDLLGGGGGGMPQEPAADSRFLSDGSMGQGGESVRGDASEFRKLEELGHLAENMPQESQELRYHDSDGEVTLGIDRLSDLERKIDESVADGGASRQWYGLTVEGADKGAKDAKTPADDAAATDGAKYDLDPAAPAAGERARERMLREVDEAWDLSVQPQREAPQAEKKGQAEGKPAAVSPDDPVRGNPALAGEGGAAVDEVRRKLYIAEGNQNLGKLEDAQKTYEEVLRIDPSNQAARRGMEKVAAAKSDYYRAAYDQTRGELLAKVDRTWEDATTLEDRRMFALDAMSEVASADEPFSTFSLHVSDASFKLAHAAMERGEVPAAEGIRPEEFYNAFDYGDPAPAAGEPVVCVTEQSAHPAFAQRNLLRIGVRTGSQGRGQSTPLNLTLLLDHSGSMEREDRNAGLAMAVRQLSSLLKEGDTITVAGFSRQPRLLADRLPGARAQELNELIERTPSEGGTNLEEGLKLGEELAKRQFNPAAQNRVVLFTDGAANLGDARPEALQARIEALRQQGIAFDAAGFGADGLNDKLLERLTRNGNGRYYVVDGPEDADAGFAKQLAGAFRPAAENVKVQVRFNPARVAKYKLIGFEEHRLQKEDFRNDAVDAAEMAAEEAGNALYQIETLPQGEGEVGEVSVRFRDVASGQMVERTWTIPYDAQAPAFDKATPSIQLAGLAAFAAEKLRAAPMADAVDFQQLGQVFAGVRARYPNSQPVADLGSMIGKMK